MLLMTFLASSTCLGEPASMTLNFLLGGAPGGTEGMFTSTFKVDLMAWMIFPFTPIRSGK